MLSKLMRLQAAVSCPQAHPSLADGLRKCVKCSISKTCHSRAGVARRTTACGFLSPLQHSMLSGHSACATRVKCLPMSKVWSGDGKIWLPACEQIRQKSSVGQVRSVASMSEKCWENRKIL